MMVKKYDPIRIMTTASSNWHLGELLLDKMMVHGEVKVRQGKKPWLSTYVE